jgi:hypothetical protein
MVDDIEVNGWFLAPVYGWRVGDYLITTDSAQAAESGVGYFTVARMADSGAEHITLTTVGMALGRHDAVRMAQIDFYQKAGQS